MQRTLEPELMDDPEQAQAYADGSFEQAHRGVVEAFDRFFPGVELAGEVLDLGCGPGDISFLFAERFPMSSVLGVDGASAMIRLARERKVRHSELGNRVAFLEACIPEDSIPKRTYAAVVSNSLLHHLHRPEVLWQIVDRHASPGTKIFIADLVRPTSLEDAARLVDTYAAGEPAILRRDFYNSLLAAFELGEIEAQIADADLGELRVERISDRHAVVFGEKG